MSINYICKSDRMFVNCFYSLIPIIEQSYNMNFSIIYSHSWDFIFSNNEQETIGERIKPFLWSNIVSPYIESFIGINLIKDENINYEEAKKVIDNEISNKNPIIITVDAINCPWTRLYKKVQYIHHILILGFDQKNGLYVGYDANLNDKVVFDFFDLRYSFYGIYLFRKGNKDLRINAKSIIKNVLNDKDSMLRNILCFRDSINSLDVEFEKQGIDRVNDMTSIIRLDEICRLRKNYISFIELFENDIKSCLEIKQSFFDSSKEWERCKLYFIKLFLTHKEGIKDDIKESIEMIVERERKSIELIRDAFDLV